MLLCCCYINENHSSNRLINSLLTANIPLTVDLRSEPKIPVKLRRLQIKKGLTLPSTYQAYIHTNTYICLFQKHIHTYVFFYVNHVSCSWTYFVYVFRNFYNVISSTTAAVQRICRSIILMSYLFSLLICFKFRFQS